MIDGQCLAPRMPPESPAKLRLFDHHHLRILATAQMAAIVSFTLRCVYTCGDCVSVLRVEVTCQRRSQACRSSESALISCLISILHFHQSTLPKLVIFVSRPFRRDYLFLTEPPIPFDMQPISTRNLFLDTVTVKQSNISLAKWNPVPRLKHDLRSIAISYIVTSCITSAIHRRQSCKVFYRQPIMEFSH